MGKDVITVGYTTHKQMIDERDKRIKQLEKALDKALYKWITHEQPKLIRGARGGFIANVRKTIDVNKSEIFKEVQDEIQQR